MRSGAIWLLVLLATLLSTPASAAKRRALLVGANQGWDEPKLSYARKDARKLRDVLVQRGGIAEEDIVVLEDPSANELREQFEAMKRRFGGRSDEATLFVFYYSGHADGEHLHLKGTPAFSFKELLVSLRGMPVTQKLGILDACQSGALLKGARSIAPGFAVEQREELSVRGLALLVSSTANESSQESRELAGSFFTHHLVSGLFGLADANGDRRVSLSEVDLYARARTVAATAHTPAGPQHPGARIELAGYEELFLTSLEGAEAILSLPPDRARCFLMDRFETRLLAELPPGDTRSNVQVPPGSYLLKCEAGAGLLHVARVDAKPGDVVDVSTALRFREKQWGGGLVKGGSPVRSRILFPLLSGGVLASGGVFLALAKHEHWRISTNDPSRGSPEEVERWTSRGQAYQALGFSLIGVGVVGLGLAMGTQWMRGPEAPVTLVVGTSGTSVSLHGKWP